MKSLLVVSVVILAAVFSQARPIVTERNDAYCTQLAFQQGLLDAQLRTLESIPAAKRTTKQKANITKVLVSSHRVLREQRENRCH